MQEGRRKSPENKYFGVDMLCKMCYIVVTINHDKEQSMVTYTKAELKEALRNQLATRPQQALKGLLRIYEYQTSQEKVAGETLEYNNVGFSGCDSKILSSMAEQFLSRGTLSEKQMKVVMRIIPRYAGQLIKISFEKGNFVKEGRSWRIK